MTDPALLDELLSDVAPGQRDDLMTDFVALSQLPATDCDLATFLSQYLDKLVRLFGATAGALWLRPPEGARLTLRAAVQWDDLDLHDGAAAANEALVRFALTQARSFLVPPYAVPHERAKVANPTSSFLVLGPVESHRDRIAVVQLFLGATPERAVIRRSGQRYLAWLDQLLRYLAQGVEQRFVGNLAPLQPALTNLEATRAEIEAFKDAIRVSLEVTLNNYAGWNFGSLRNNQTFTRSVHELLDANSFRVECPECGAPAILRCQSAGNSKTGVFLYDHYLESGRTFHGGPSTFPLVRLIPKPPRRTRQ